MSNPNRRVFVITAVAGTCALVATRVSAQAAAPVLSETDPQAAALGYKADTTKVDQKKYPKHTADQRCSNCSLYQGKAADAMAPCTLFQGKQVAGPGWCSAWVKKAA